MDFARKKVHKVYKVHKVHKVYKVHKVEPLAPKVTGVLRTVFVGSKAAVNKAPAGSMTLWTL
ncbi:hypothetical protein DWW52_02880 [Odoribacter sp. AF15-53]|nr:hypothetical protein DWW52_02880 [Odoribacter sp. AF15-53]